MWYSIERGTLLNKFFIFLTQDLYKCDLISFKQCLWNVCESKIIMILFWELMNTIVLLLWFNIFNILAFLWKYSWWSWRLLKTYINKLIFLLLLTQFFCDNCFLLWILFYHPWLKLTFNPQSTCHQVYLWIPNIWK